MRLALLSTVLCAASWKTAHKSQHAYAADRPGHDGGCNVFARWSVCAPILTPMEWGVSLFTAGTAVGWTVMAVRNPRVWCSPPSSHVHFSHFLLCDKYFTVFFFSNLETYLLAWNHRSTLGKNKVF